MCVYPSSSLGRTSSGHRVASSRTNYASGHVPDNQAEGSLAISFSTVVTGRGKCGRFQFPRIQQMKATLRSKLLAQSLQRKSHCQGEKGRSLCWMENGLRPSYSSLLLWCLLPAPCFFTQVKNCISQGSLKQPDVYMRFYMDTNIQVCGRQIYFMELVHAVVLSGKSVPWGTSAGWKLW